MVGVKRDGKSKFEEKEKTKAKKGIKGYSPKAGVLFTNDAEKKKEEGGGSGGTKRGAKKKERKGGGRVFAAPQKLNWQKLWGRGKGEKKLGKEKEKEREENEKGSGMVCGPGRTKQKKKLNVRSDGQKLALCERCLKKENGGKGPGSQKRKTTATGRCLVLSQRGKEQRKGWQGEDQREKSEMPNRERMCQGKKEVVPLWGGPGKKGFR